MPFFFAFDVTLLLQANAAYRRGVRGVASHVVMPIKEIGARYVDHFDALERRAA